MKNRRQNQLGQQQGFAMVAAVVALPLCLLAMWCLYTVKALVLPEEMSLHLCRTSLLQAQPKIAAQIKLLLNLNSEVAELRIARQDAQQAADSALESGYPVAIAATQAALAAVIAEQEALRAEQNTIIEEGNSAMLLGQSQAETLIRSQLLKLELNAPKIFSFSSSVQPTDEHTLAVQPLPGDDPGPPQYKLMDPFSESQAIQVSWDYNIKTNPFRRIQWRKLNLRKKLACAATLKEDFTPVLTVANP